mmetsp:Transcript_26605/g.67585  ORF Transcript_26605/g.67585 Transcript_26605/m.67585 type:complete len:93 (-) Transcript_26605:122-400(-)
MLDLHRGLAPLVLDRVREAFDVLLHCRVAERPSYQPLDVIDGVGGVLPDLVLGRLTHELFPILRERHPRWCDAASQIIRHNLHLSIPIHAHA